MLVPLQIIILFTLLTYFVKGKYVLPYYYVNNIK